MTTITTLAARPAHWAGLTVLAVYQAAPLVDLPVVTSTCWYCEQQVELAFQDTYTVSRVDGDSKYGYEPCHVACQAAIAAERDADDEPVVRCNADKGEACSCSNGIGCVHVPYDRW